MLKRCSDEFLNADHDVNFLTTCYNQVVSSVLNSVLSTQTKTVTSRRTLPWFSREIMTAIRQRRRLERVWRISKSAEDREKFVAQCNVVSHLVIKAKSSYYTKKINDNLTSNNWFTIRQLLHRLLATTAPPGCTSSLSASVFSDFFVNKINSICDNIRPSCISSESLCVYRLDTFAPATFSETSSVLLKMKSKTSCFDPIPSWVIKLLPSIFVPILCKIVNTSFDTGCFPASEKEAVITPVLKKGKCAANLSNYRPISCLSFLSKFIERFIYIRLSNYFESNLLLPPMQSAYRRGFSTETAICKLLNDIFVAKDSGLSTVLVQLNLSAAFDTVDHHMLLYRLQQSFGLSGNVISWIRSYLANRKQCVRFGGSVSEASHLCVGVPQGSVFMTSFIFCVYRSIV